jgi:hypothetical protein
MLIAGENVVRATLILFVITFVGHSAFAAEDREVAVDRFQGIDIGTGITAEVFCGEESRVLVQSSKQAFDNLHVAVHGSTLKIHLDSGWLNMFTHDHGHISATVYTTERLQEIEASTGSGLEIDACAVSGDELDVGVSTGAEVKISGETERLDLKVGTGGSFNTGRYKDDLRVSKASVRLSTGANAGLCGAGLVVGRLSTGAQIAVSEDADIKVRLGTGAGIEDSACW